MILTGITIGIAVLTLVLRVTTLRARKYMRLAEIENERASAALDLGELDIAKRHAEEAHALAQRAHRWLFPWH